MQYLTLLDRADDAVWYALEGDFASPVARYVVSTPETRELCNRPELAGWEYTHRLQRGVARAVAAAPFRAELEAVPEDRVCVLNFLRGGLNFGLREALHDALGLNRHSSVFMSSQRSRAEDGRWQVREDMYRKLRIPKGAFMLAGDVVATGITVEHGLEVIFEHLLAIGSSIRSLAFFTIGCHKLEKRLNEFDARCREAFPDYERTHAVYFEGKLRLVDSHTGLRIGLPGTDLIRRDALLAPEFEASQWERASYPLERCAIYDAGTRAFDVPTYAEDVLGYWAAVRELAAGGLTLAEALEERWPRTGYATRGQFFEARRALWRGLDDDALLAVYERYETRWPEHPEGGGHGAEALLALCDERLLALHDSLGGAP
jgi:hypothetical protein